MSGEAIAPESNFNLEEQCRIMSTELLAASKAIDDSINRLPVPTCTDQERQDKIVELWKEHNELEEKLQIEVDELDDILTKLQEVRSGTLHNRSLMRT